MRGPRLPNLERYRDWIACRDDQEADGYAERINNQQSRVVMVEAQFLNATEELRRLHAVGALAADITAQIIRVDELAQRLRAAQTDVREMRAYARHQWPRHFLQ